MAKGKRSKGSVRAKAGLPAKAGRRKVYGPSSKRKVKDWGALGTGYVMNSMNGGPLSGPIVQDSRNTPKYGEQRLTERELELRREALRRSS